MKRKYMYRYNIDERQLAIDCAMEEATVVAYKQAKLDDAKTMLADGLEPRLVARYTKLPIKQIKTLM